MDVLYLPPCIHNSSSFFNSEKVEVSTDVWETRIFQPVCLDCQRSSSKLVNVRPG